MQSAFQVNVPRICTPSDLAGGVSIFENVHKGDRAVFAELARNENYGKR